MGSPGDRDHPNYVAYIDATFAAALQILRPLADQGNTGAQFTLGQIYASGRAWPTAILLFSAVRDGSQGVRGPRMNIRRSAMSDADLSERRAAALESSARSKAMKPAASKTWRDRRADVDSCGPAKAMKTSKARRDRRADVGSSGAVILMKIAAAKAAVEAAAGKTRGDGRGAGVETGRRMNATGAKATKTRATAKDRNAAGAQTDGRRSAAGA